MFIPMTISGFMPLMDTPCLVLKDINYISVKENGLYSLSLSPVEIVCFIALSNESSICLFCESVRFLERYTVSQSRSGAIRQKDLLERYGSVLAVKPQIEKINSRLNELRSQRKTVYLSRNLTDSQKRQMLDSLDKAIKQTFRS